MPRPKSASTLTLWRLRIEHRSKASTRRSCLIRDELRLHQQFVEMATRNIIEKPFASFREAPIPYGKQPAPHPPSVAPSIALATHA